LQPPPGLAGLEPWFDLASLHSRIGEQERDGEVVPARVAEEVSEVQGVPGAVANHPTEAGARVSAGSPSRVSMVTLSLAASKIIRRSGRVNGVKAMRSRTVSSVSI